MSVRVRVSVGVRIRARARVRARVRVRVRSATEVIGPSRQAPACSPPTTTYLLLTNNLLTYLLTYVPTPPHLTPTPTTHAPTHPRHPTTPPPPRQVAMLSLEVARDATGGRLTLPPGATHARLLVNTFGVPVVAGVA